GGGDDQRGAGQRVPAKTGRRRVGSVRPVHRAGVCSRRDLCKRPPVRHAGPAEARRLIEVDDLPPIGESAAALPEGLPHETHTLGHAAPISSRRASAWITGGVSAGPRAAGARVSLRSPSTLLPGLLACADPPTVAAATARARG